MKRKILTALLIICALAAFLAVNTVAAEVASGTCGARGDNLTWTLDDAGTLTIDGEGEMTYWGNTSQIPWYSNKSNIKSVVIGDSVTSIADFAFWGCSNLTSVDIGDSVTSIGILAFSDCDSLTSVNIPDSVTVIGEGAFGNCEKLMSVDISNNITSIQSSAFYNTGYYNDLNNWENNVLYIGSYIIEAKHSISDSYTIKAGTKCIGDAAFSDCDSLTSVNIPDSVTSIGEYVFYNCRSLTSVVIPDSVTSIGRHAFYDCNSLTSVVISDSITSIEESTFNNCTNLADVYYTGSEDEWYAISIDRGNKPLLNATIHFNYVSIPGDINRDGEVTSEDSVYFSRYFAEWAGYTTAPTADIGDLDNSGIVDTTDSVILSRHLAKWTGYLTLPVGN